MKLSGYIFSLVAALILIALPVAAQVNDTYVVPAVGNTAGAFGTRWQTRLSVFNPQNFPLKVSVTLTPGVGQSQPAPVSLTIPSNSVAFYDNVLASLFNFSGTGALLLATFPEDNPGHPNMIDRSFLVTSSTYNNAASGTYGQTIPGIWTGLQDDGITAIAHGILNLDSQGWRTNVGAVNLSDTSVTMRVSVYDIDGRTILNKAPFQIAPYSFIQDRLPVQVDAGSVEFFLEDPSSDNHAVVFPYTSTIDQYSGDPTYQSPILLASAKVIFPKTGMVPDPNAGQNVGKKIGIAEARGARDHAIAVSGQSVREVAAAVQHSAR